MVENPLEEQARRYAKRAVLADREHRYEEALIYYKKAVDLINKLVQLYPETTFAPLYRVLAEKYSKRIKELEKRVTETIVQKTEDNVFNVNILYPNMKERRAITFRDVVGLDDVKALLKRIVIYPVRNPKLYPLGWPKGILFYGPPGCGKTYLVLALANEANAVLISATAADIIDKYLGDAEKNVKKLFSTARNLAKKGLPVILFIDEVDSLLRVFDAEVGGESRVRSQFLTEMDGILNKLEDRLPLFIIGTTNKPWLLDHGFIRRFQKRIYIPPPDRKTRRKLFEYYINKLKTIYILDKSVDLDKLAELTKGYSSFDISQIVMEVQNNVAEEVIEKYGSLDKVKDRPITMEDFIRVIRSVKPSIDPKHLRLMEEWSKSHMSI